MSGSRHSKKLSDQVEKLIVDWGYQKKSNHSDVVRFHVLVPLITLCREKGECESSLLRGDVVAQQQSRLPCAQNVLVMLCGAC
jgi:hypothetical protein